MFGIVFTQYPNRVHILIYCMNRVQWHPDHMYKLAVSIQHNIYLCASVSVPGVWCVYTMSGENIKLTRPLCYELWNVVLSILFSYVVCGGFGTVCVCTVRK